MSEEKAPKQKWPKILFAVVCALVVVYAVFITVVNRNLVEQREQQQKAEVITSQLPGLACGVLSPSLAKATIGEPVKRTARNDHNIAFEDGCTYANPGNSSQYASLVIKSYPTEKDAAEGFAKERILHIQTENRDPGDLGDEMYYSAGTFYVLRGNQTIGVGAAKTYIDENEQEAFSKKLLESVVENL